MEKSTQKQINYLIKLGLSSEEVKALNIREASIKIRELLKQEAPKIPELWNSLEEWEKKRVDFIGGVGKYKLIFEKPQIETSFCFGYGFCGVSTQEQYDNANEMVEYARKNQQYFLNENLKNINKEIEAVESFIYYQSEEWQKVERDEWQNRGAKNWQELVNKYGAATKAHPIHEARRPEFMRMVLVNNYNNKPEKYNKIEFVNSWMLSDDPRAATEWESKQLKLRLICELGLDEARDYLSGLKLQREHFIKRLKTYLKRYGTSKLNTWSYLVD